MAVPTLITAILLIVVGVVGYASQDPGTASPTALIPAAVGLVLAVCGLLAFKDKFRKHAMHLAVVVGLVGFFGGFMPLQRQAKAIREKADPPISMTDAWSQVDPLKKSAVSGELMSLICAVFVGMCVNSFIQARKARAAAAGQKPPA